MWWMVELGNLCKRMVLMADAGGRPLVGIADTNRARVCMSVSCECCVSLGRGLFVGLITRPEEFY
jgi:hypothetical protein